MPWPAQSQHPMMICWILKISRKPNRRPPRHPTRMDRFCQRRFLPLAVMPGPCLRDRLRHPPVERQAHPHRPVKSKRLHPPKSRAPVTAMTMFSKAVQEQQRLAPSSAPRLLSPLAAQTLRPSRVAEAKKSYLESPLPQSSPLGSISAGRISTDPRISPAVRKRLYQHRRPARNL